MKHKGDSTAIMTPTHKMLKILVPIYFDDVAIIDITQLIPSALKTYKYLLSSLGLTTKNDKEISISSALLEK